MIKFYDSVEKWQFSFFHPTIFVPKESALFLMVVKHHFPLRFFRAFYTISLNIFYHNLSNPKHKSLKLFWASSMAIDIKLDDFESTQYAS